MKHPIFHPDEEARIGRYAHDSRLIGQGCTVRCLMKPIGGEHRYGVKTESGMYTIVLESTLQKQFERSDWGMLRGIWQPKREAR
jgi:hypothetical protein